MPFQITAGHVLDYLVDDPGTRAVAIFMETGAGIKAASCPVA